MIREAVLRDFPNWDAEKQLAEYQAYKGMGDYSPFTEGDYQLMEMVMKNPNAEVAVECEDGICQIVSDDTVLDESETTETNDEIISEETDEVVIEKSKLDSIIEKLSTFDEETIDVLEETINEMFEPNDEKLKRLKTQISNRKKYQKLKDKFHSNETEKMDDEYFELEALVTSYGTSEKDDKDEIAKIKSRMKQADAMRKSGNFIEDSLPEGDKE